MPDPRRLELTDLVNRPGTYFNPQTEVLLVVDDSPHLDVEIFDAEKFESTEWVLISDEVPIEEHERDELLERFQIHYEAAADADEDEDGVQEEELEPDEEPRED